MPINIAKVAALVEPVVRKHFGLGRGKRVSQAKSIFKFSGTDESMKEIVEGGGPGPLTLKNELAPVLMDDVFLGPVKRFNAVTYASGLELSFESLEDLKRKAPEITKAASALGTAVERTPEYLCALFLDRAFDTGFPATPDGLPVCSTGHILPNGTTAANCPTGVMTSFSEAGVEEAMTAMRTMKGSHGMIEPLTLKKLVVPSAKANLAKKLARGTKEYGTANNTPSVVNDVVEGFAVFDFLASSTRWFALTDAEGGPFWEYRHDPEFIQDNSPSVLKALFVAFFRALWGIENWRSIYGSNAV